MKLTNLLFLSISSGLFGMTNQEITSPHLVSIISHVNSNNPSDRIVVTGDLQHKTIEFKQITPEIIQKAYTQIVSTIKALPQIFQLNNTHYLQLELYKINKAIFATGFHFKGTKLDPVLHKFHQFLQRYNELLFTPDGQFSQLTYAQERELKELHIQFIQTYFKKDAQLMINELRKTTPGYQIAFHGMHNKDGVISAGKKVANFFKEAGTKIYDTFTYQSSEANYIKRIATNKVNTAIEKVEHLWSEAKYQEAFDHIQKSDINSNKDIQQIYQDRYSKMVDPILKKARINVPNRRTLQIIDGFLSIQAQNGNEAAYFADALAIDNPDPQIQQLYHAYFNDNGVYKGYENHPLLMDVAIPNEMGTVENTEARVYLHNLLDQKMYDDTITNQIRTAISYTLAAAYDTPLKDDYLNLAKAYHDALVNGQNKEALVVGNLTNTDNISEAERNLLVSINSNLVGQLQTAKESKIRTRIQQALITIENMRTSNNQTFLNNYFSELVPQINAIPDFQTNFENLNIAASELMPLDQQATELSPEYAQRQEARWQAQEAQQVEAQFVLTDKSIGLLYDHNINIEKYQEKHDKPIVQHAANEAIDIFNQAAEIKEQDVVPLEFLDLAVTTTDKGFDQVYNGNLQGFDLIECGHAYCAYGEAVVKGITLGIWDTAKGMVLDHPMQTAMMIIAPEGYFAYQLGKITYKLAGTGLLYVFNPEKGKKDWADNYLKPIKEIISVLASNEVPGPEKVGIVTRVGTGIAAEYLLTKKLKKAYKKLITDPRLQNLGKNVIEHLDKKLSGNITKTMQAGKSISEKAARLIWKNSKDLKVLQEKVNELKKIVSNEKIGTAYDGKNDWTKLDKAAKALYQKIRNTVDDIEKISKNTGIPVEIIKKIKDHVFYEEHILLNGIKKFAPNYDMAQAWQRLIEKEYIFSDLQLLIHEYAESLIMRGTMVNYDTAHSLTNKFCNWYSNLD